MNKETRSRRKIKKWKFPVGKLILILFIIGCASLFTHMMDRWTVPIQNEITIDQLNGGDAELVTRDVTNSFLNNMRIGIWPVAVFIILIIIFSEIVKCIKLIESRV